MLMSKMLHISPLDLILKKRNSEKWKVATDALHLSESKCYYCRNYDSKLYARYVLQYY